MNITRAILAVTLSAIGVQAQTLPSSGVPAPTGPPLPAGVSVETRAAIEAGLAWLARNQAADGSWRNAGSDGGYPVAMTSLAGMAFVASGSTPTRGRHWREVRSAVDFLLRCADRSRTSGLIDHEGERQSMFGHGFATMLLASVYGMEEDLVKQQRLKLALDRATRLTSRAQSSAGGWIYTPDSNADEGSVTVTQIQAMRACHMAGIVVDKRTVDRAVAYVKGCQNGDGGIRYRLSGPPASRPAITAAGIAVFYNAGFYDDAEFVAAAYRFCDQHIRVRIDTTNHHFYTHLYWSQALYQRGGQPWDDYYAEVSTWLRERQHRDGQWDGDSVGPVYGTAIALTILQLPYALVPVYQR
ncbi:MAG: terpene cyclase/mutase family protein [Planctomycetes bacterium]|nr:terpene cyclase/mutase family protein [Planctomycetota bacterium]